MYGIVLLEVDQRFVYPSFSGLPIVDCPFGIL